MVFASIGEQASSAFIFASTSSDQILCLASSQHLKGLKKIMTCGEQGARRKFWANRNLSFGPFVLRKETLFNAK